MLRIDKNGFPGMPLLDGRTGRRHAPESGSRASHAVKLARRDAACTRILVLLKDGPMSAVDLSGKIGALKPTTYAYLRYMAIDLRSVRRAGRLDEHKRDLWELGEDVFLPTREEMEDASFAERRRTVPAKQVGMWRDGLVAALFGAPDGGAAA